MAKVNFLLGKAERLVRPVTPPKIDPDKAHPYGFDTARDRLIPKLVADIKRTIGIAVHHLSARRGGCACDAASSISCKELFSRPVA